MSLDLKLAKVLGQKFTQLNWHLTSLSKFSHRLHQGDSHQVDRSILQSNLHLTAWPELLSKKKPKSYPIYQSNPIASDTSSPSTVGKKHTPASS